MSTYTHPLPHINYQFYTSVHWLPHTPTLIWRYLTHARKISQWFTPWYTHEILYSATLIYTQPQMMNQTGAACPQSQCVRTHQSVHSSAATWWLLSKRPRAVLGKTANQRPSRRMTRLPTARWLRTQKNRIAQAGNLWTNDRSLFIRNAAQLKTKRAPRFFWRGTLVEHISQAQRRSVGGGETGYFNRSSCTHTCIHILKLNFINALPSDKVILWILFQF